MPKSRQQFVGACMKVRSLVLAALLLVAGPALAQKMPAPPPPPATPPPPAPLQTPSPNAEARAWADRLIEQAGADGLFVNVSDGSRPAARHVRSGLVCRFAMAEGDRLFLFDPGPANPGDDVGCNTFLSSHGGAWVTFYATRYRSGDLNVYFSEALEEMRARYATMDPWTPARASTPSDGPMVRHARFIATEEGAEPVYTRLSIAQVGEWTIMMRFSGAAAEAESLDQIGGRAFGVAVSGVTTR